MFLTEQEIVDLTKRRHHSAQARALNGMGIIHKERADGTLAVLRDHVQKVMGGLETAATSKKVKTPNWNALNA